MSSSNDELEARLVELEARMSELSDTAAMSLDLDIVWIIVSAVLVFFMQVGFAMVSNWVVKGTMVFEPTLPFFNYWLLEMRCSKFQFQVTRPHNYTHQEPRFEATVTYSRTVLLHCTAVIIESSLCSVSVR